MEGPLTIYYRHADGYDHVDEALDLCEAMQTIEDYANDHVNEGYGLKKIFPIYWSLCELGATDICYSGLVALDVDKKTYFTQ